MLIHFPAALLPADLVLSFLFYYTGTSSYGQSAFYCLVGGTVLGWLSAITGLTDLVGAREQKPALNTMLLHGGINLAVVMGFSVFAWKSWKLFPLLQAPTTLTLLVKSMLVLLLLLGNYLGGRLILKYHIAVEHDKPIA